MLIGALPALVSIRVSAEGADGILECKAKVPNRTSVALAKKKKHWALEDATAWQMPYGK